MRTSKLDWELYKEQLLAMKSEGKSLTDINKVLFEKLGFCYSNARLSQKFKEWATPVEVVTQLNVEEAYAN